MPFVSVDGNIPSSGSMFLTTVKFTLNILGWYSISLKSWSFFRSCKFQQLSPVILRAATKNDNSLYTEKFLQQESKYTAIRRVWASPLECRVLGQENLLSCQFLILSTMTKLVTAMQNIAATPDIFKQYSDRTGVGHLIFECKNGGAGFDESGNIDLKYLLGQRI